MEKISHLHMSHLEKVIEKEIDNIKKVNINKDLSGKFLHFKGLDGEFDYYNPSVPFDHNGKTYFAVRVEARDDELNTKTYFAYQDKVSDRLFYIDNDISPLNLQDPFVSRINNELVVGGVEVNMNETTNDICYKTVFYRGHNLKNLQKFAQGPDRMKDLRLLELNNGQILVATRPQNIINIDGKDIDYKGGRIGFKVIPNLESLTDTDFYRDVNIIDNLHKETHWSGVNQMFSINNDTIGVVYHEACFNAGEKKYVSGFFTINAKMLKYNGDKRTIGDSTNFSGYTPKKADLNDVVFSSGVVVKSNSCYNLYLGIGDSKSGVIKNIKL